MINLLERIVRVVTATCASKRARRSGYRSLFKVDSPVGKASRSKRLSGLTFVRGNDILGESTR